MHSEVPGVRTPKDVFWGEHSSTCNTPYSPILELVRKESALSAGDAEQVCDLPGATGSHLPKKR